MHEAEQCEKFHFENDYKMNAITNFWKDHISKHIKDHNKCMGALDAHSTVAAKDRAYADCHNGWLRDFKIN